MPRLQQLPERVCSVIQGHDSEPRMVLNSKLELRFCFADWRRRPKL